MRILIKFLILTILLSACSNKKELLKKQEQIFSSEILHLKQYFEIPGLAVTIEKNGSTIFREYYGASNLNQSTPLDSSTLFPIASITKVFSGVLVMRLVEQGKLSLDDPINSFLAQPILADSILVKHILSHTSQGTIGKNFLYSSRFGLITNVIEKASGKPYSEALQQIILNPLKLDNTFLLKDSTQINRVAKPYILNNGIEDGFIDYGYSSSAGIVSNLDDLAIFNNALDNNLIISNSSKNLMFRPFDDSLPYGSGIFNQQFKNFEMVWSYGQYDCYSSLILKIPSKNITLIMLANNNLLSDPARLINGDVTSSLFALSFLKNYLLELDEMSLIEKHDSISRPISNAEFYRKKLLAQAQAESYMSRFETNTFHLSAALLGHIFADYPNYLEYANLNLLHTLVFLKDVAFYMDLGEFDEFDTEIEKIGKKLLIIEPNNPYVHSYLGTFYARIGANEKAKYHFEHIVNAKNFTENWYTNEAQQWLNENI